MKSQGPLRRSPTRRFSPSGTRTRAQIIQDAFRLIRTREQHLHRRLTGQEQSLLIKAEFNLEPARCLTAQYPRRTAGAASIGRHALYDTTDPSSAGAIVQHLLAGLQVAR